MKCLDCLNANPAPVSLIDNYCRCKFSENWVYSSLTYERQCDKFKEMTDEQRAVKRQQWELIKNPVRRKENDEEASNDS